MTKKPKTASSAADDARLARPEEPKSPLASEPAARKWGGLVFVAVIVGLMLLVIAIDLLRR